MRGFPPHKPDNRKLEIHMSGYGVNQVSQLHGHISRPPPDRLHVVEDDVVSRMLMPGVLLVQLIFADSICAETRWIEGTYRNPALGYSVRIPRGLRGKTGDQDGPERGIKIVLPSGSEVVVLGEPNSLEWKSPEDGVRAELAYETCDSGQPEVKQARVGKLNGAKASLLCGDRILTEIVVFRPGGGLIYWIRLETARTHESEDSTILESIAASFKLIRRE
jgi:hypothetical protein